MYCRACVTAGSAQAPGVPATIAWNLDGPPTRSSRYSIHISSVQACEPARAIGVTPLAFSAATSASRSAQVAGAAVMPALAKAALLENSETGCTPSIGTP